MPKRARCTHDRTRTLQTLLAVITAIGFTGPTAFAADADPKATITAAAQKLADESGYRWTTVVETAGRFGGGTTEGRIAKDGFTFVSLPSFGGTLDFAIKGGHTAVKLEDIWQSVGQVTRADRRAGRRLRGVTDFKLPVVRAQELLAKATAFRRDGDALIGTLSASVVSEMLSSGGRGRRPGRARPTVKDPKGSVTFWLADGRLAKYRLELSGSMEFRGESRPLDQTSTMTITGIGASEDAVPEHAETILEALLAGIAPPNYAAERGFVSLFNGKDLTGWVGRPEHWSVEDGAITGRTTTDNPARGNNFLIATRGGKRLIVDDFELRLSYRIVANNSRGFANSGIQYRSIERDNFGAAGYQADFEAGNQFSGILYDEAGGAGGRGIMATRGQNVVWTAACEKEVTGQLRSSEEIQAAIKPNDWNDYVVIARGKHLQHFINGVQTVDVFDDCESKRLTAGILALQIHAGQPMTVHFKDIRIKSLSSVATTAASNLKVADGFKLERLYTVPKDTEGSWVAMCTDPRGRLIVSDQNGKLYRLTPPPVGSSRVIQPETIDLEIGGAHGLLYAFDSLYVMVNENADGRGLYRLRDTNGDDHFDKVELLRKLEGGGEHGVHSIVLAPDKQSLYIVCGDATALTNIDSSRVPLNFSEDHLLPRMTTGFMADTLAPGGWIARIDPDGKHWELISIGFRNEFEAAFTREGDLFTYDADMEWDINAPWYRPTRMNHVISGADFGWRNGAGKWPAYYIDSFGAALDIGPGSPTGISFGYGAKFPAKYQDALFVCDWSFGKLYAVHLTPDGSSYTGELEEFVSGQPLPLTDVVISPFDGAMYFTLGGRRTQSALYRVTYVGSESTAPSPGDTRSQEERKLRRTLEGFHGHQDARAVDSVWPHLGHADRAIRHAARTALEWQDPTQWSDRALAETDLRTAIAALVALARASGKDEFHRQPTDPKPDPALKGKMLAALNKLHWPSLSQSDRLDLMRAYELVFTRLGRPHEAERRQLIRKFDPLFPAGTSALNVRLSNMLVYLQANTAATKIVAALRSAPTREEQIDYALALRVLETGWTLPLREEYFRWFLSAANFRGGRTLGSSIDTIRRDAITTLNDDEKRVLRPILSARPERKSPQELLAARAFVKEWTVDELVPIVERGLAGGRSFSRGRKLFADVACASCHRFDLEGAGVGPDLTTVAARFSVRDLLESTVEPSKAISDQYAAIMIRTVKGDVVTGRVGNLNGDSLNVIENMLSPGDFTNVRRQDIESIEPSSVSIMPEGLMNSLEEDEIQDLLAFLLSRGDPEHRMFSE